MPTVSKDVSLIIQISPSGYKLYRADLERPWKTFLACRALWDLNEYATEAMYDVVAEGTATEKVDVLTEAIRAAKSRPELMVIWQDAKRAGTWTEAHDALSKEIAKTFAA